MPTRWGSGDDKRDVRWLRGRSDGVMQEDQSGSENQQPEDVGPCAPLANEPDPPGGSQAREAGQGQPGDPARLAGARASSDDPGGQPAPSGSEPPQPGGQGQP